MPRLRRLVPLLLVALALALAFDLDRYLSLDALRRYFADLAAFTQARLPLAALLFLLAYVVAAAVALPGAAVLTIAGGALFGTALASILTIAGATIGATLLFLAVRTALGDWLAGKLGPRLAQMRGGFARDGFTYLLVLRLVPLFPFWMVNVAAGLAGLRLPSFVGATLIGISPATIVYSGIGAGAASALAAGGDVPLTGVLTRPEVLWPMAGLVLLSLVPIGYRRWRMRAPGATVPQRDA